MRDERTRGGRKQLQDEKKKKMIGRCGFENNKLAGRVLEYWSQGPSCFTPQFSYGV